MKVKRQSEISSASLAGTATNNIETPTHLGAVTPGVQPHQGSWRKGSVWDERGKQRERGSIPRWGFNGVAIGGGDWSLSTLSGGGHTRRTSFFQSSGFTPILSNLSTSSSFPSNAASHSFLLPSSEDMVVLLHFRLLCVVG
jgi:hypothetical protein